MRIDGDNSSELGYSFEFLTREVSIGTWARVMELDAEELVRDQYPNRAGANADLPLQVNNMCDVFAFCNRLSDLNAIEPNEWCFPENLDYRELQNRQMFVGRKGYRIPTIDEWRIACDSATKEDHFFGTVHPLALNYCWCAKIQLAILRKLEQGCPTILESTIHTAMYLIVVFG